MLPYINYKKSANNKRIKRKYKTITNQYNNNQMIIKVIKNDSF